jgi:purine-binding chemotaxis protein CheW
VVVRHGTRQVGILVEDVPEIRTIQSSDLLAHPVRTAAERPVLSSGSFKAKKKPNALLEISRLLASIEGTANNQHPYRYGETMVPEQIRSITSSEQEGRHGEG